MIVSKDFLLHKFRLNENRLATAAALGLVGSAMAAPPKQEALERMLKYMKEKEGFRAVAEIDKDASTKPVVIGYGTTHKYPDSGKHIQLGDKITPEKAEEYIKTSLNKMTPDLEKIPGWDEMDAGKQAALLSFGYNFGSQFYKPNAEEKDKFYSISQDLKNKNWKNIPETLKLYNKSGGKVMGGLVTRREEEGNMWREGDNKTNQQKTTPNSQTVTEPKTPVTTQEKPVTTQEKPVTTRSRSHTIVRGDTLGAIAKKYNKTVQQIMSENPDITDPNLIKAGKTLRIPD